MAQEEIKEMANNETILPKPAEIEQLPEENNENPPADPPLPKALIEWLAMINRRWSVLQEESQAPLQEGKTDIPG